MVLTDIHNHSDFSFDGKASLADMVAAAQKKGLRYFGIAEHFDNDFLDAPFFYGDEELTETTDPYSYFPAARKLQARLNGDHFTLLAGAEFGYHPNERIQGAFRLIADEFHPDFIVNSVHSCDGVDCMEKKYFFGKDKRTAYARYFERVRESLDCDYPYDIVAHLGYVSRKAPYPDPKIRYGEFADQLDDILRTIIAKGKILEVNSSSRTAGSEFLPDTDILSRYYELGGRRVSFGSDAHNADRICDRREIVVSALKAIGFTFITVPVCGEHVKVEI